MSAENDKKLLQVQAEARHLSVMSMRPDNPPERQALLGNLQRSARAEIDLRGKVQQAEAKAFVLHPSLPSPPT